MYHNLFFIRTGSCKSGVYLHKYPAQNTNFTLSLFSFVDVVSANVCRCTMVQVRSINRVPGWLRKYIRVPEFLTYRG